ncbi:MAG: hypothetical protein NPIRA02_01600 [Nitrospirales bacterium]|nr:MAG: hypothetical protein NPIRA02_01600 [Nitrospirales bacterium]
MGTWDINIKSRDESVDLFITDTNAARCRVLVRSHTGYLDKVVALFPLKENVL